MNCPERRGYWSATEGCARLGGTWDRSRCSVATVRQGRGRAVFVVTEHRQILVVGAAICEPMSQIRIAVGIADTGPQPRGEEYDCVSTDEASFPDLLIANRSQVPLRRCWI